MNIRVRAAVDVIVFFIGAITVASAVSFILATVPFPYIMYGVGAGFFAYMIYIMYSIRVSQLESIRKLNERQ